MKARTHYSTQKFLDDLYKQEIRRMQIFMLKELYGKHYRKAEKILVKITKFIDKLDFVFLDDQLRVDGIFMDGRKVLGSMTIYYRNNWQKEYIMKKYMNDLRFDLNKWGVKIDFKLEEYMK